MDNHNTKPRGDYREPSPEDVLLDAASRFAVDKIAISFSGAEDVVLIDMAHKLGLNVGVFSLDTGRLHAETYRFIEDVRSHYGITIELLYPEAEAVQNLVREKGLFSFYKDGHNECCSVRKIAPLRRKLETLDAWITGQRRDQSVTRTEVPHEQLDKAFSTGSHTVTKFNPLAGWSSADVWAYIRENEVPCNPLHDRGFVSIGCEPCTRAVGPHEHERAGRWWWEEATQKECGLHSQNVIKIISR
jgi:phosphoadenosine phosphosulfate reductase